jgi:hypothetical protein
VYFSFVYVTGRRDDIVYGRRSYPSKNVSHEFVFKRREGTSSGVEIEEEVLIHPRRLKRVVGRVPLPRGEMRIGDFEPESTSSDDDEESPYRKKPTPPNSPTAAAQRKRKRKEVRTTSHEHSQGTWYDEEEENEYINDGRVFISMLC